MTYCYPANDLDRPNKLLGLLGSVWAETYVARDVLRDRCTARLEHVRRNYALLLEAVASLSRYEIPVYHTENWTALRLRRSQCRAINGKYTFDLPADLVEFSLLMNRITNPSCVFHAGIDFTVGRLQKQITFSKDPFANEQIQQAFMADSDLELVLWVFRGQFDWNLIYDHFGYMLDLNLPSSENYKALVNAILDCAVDGTSVLGLEKVLSLLFDYPLVREPVEIIEDVIRQQDALLVITDKNVYKYAPSAETNRIIGDTVFAGDALTVWFMLPDLRRNHKLPNLPAITLSEGMLAPGIGPITFKNALVTVTRDGNELRWPLEGSTLAVDAFWAAVAAREAKYGHTLADALPASVSVINPMEFLIANVLKWNAVVVQVKWSEIGPAVLHMRVRRLLRKIVPPHTAVIIVEV